MKVKIKKLNSQAILPQYVHSTDAAFDIRTIENYTLVPGERKLFRSGLAMELEDGFVALIKDRSGLAVKKGLTVLGGVVDAGYRGDYGIILLNTGKEAYTVQAGERIAQVIILPVMKAEFEEVKDLGESERGEKGFGSSGTIKLKDRASPEGERE